MTCSFKVEYIFVKLKEQRDDNSLLSISHLALKSRSEDQMATEEWEGEGN